MLAVERVNADEALLPGRTLEYSWADSGCDGKTGLWALGTLLVGNPEVNAVIGPGCSAACEVTSISSSLRGIPQISFGCTSPTLSDKSKYELFSRTVSPNPSKGPALVALFGHYNWTKAVMLTSTDGVYFESGLKLTRQLEAEGIKVLKPAAFEPGRFTEGALDKIRRSSIRIVLVLARIADTKAVASSARRAGMGGAGWAWISHRTRSSLDKELAGWLSMRPLLPSQGMQAFAEQVSKYTGSHFPDSVDNPDSVDLASSAALYDAIMLYAHAATTVMSKGGDLRDGQAVTVAIRNTSFTGVGGTVVSLDSNGDRMESYEVMNYVLEGDRMNTVAVGVFNATLKEYKAYERAVVWPGNNTMDVPADSISGALCWIVMGKLALDWIL